ncbi:MAG: hypothetical protein GX444_13300 [Myxococcales bacterium]|nr:hypothetical protein [Myxococcales bacterium]
MDHQWKGRALGAILSESSMVTPGDIERALEEQKRSGLRIGEALIKLGIVTRDDINWGLSHQLNVPFVRLQPELIDPEAARIVPAEMARRHRLVPYLLIGDELTVVVEDPTNRRAADELEKITGKHLIIGVGLPEEISACLEAVYRQNAAEPFAPDLTSSLFPPERVAELAADSSGRLLVEALLQTTIEQDADSLEFTPRHDRVEVLLRHGADVRLAATLSLSWMHVVARQVKQRINRREERHETLLGLLPYRHLDLETHFQATIIRTDGGEAISLVRPAPPSLQKEIGQCRQTAESADAWARLRQARGGLLVLAGADPAARWALARQWVKERGALDRKAVFLGRSLVFTDDPLLRIQPTDLSADAWQRALETAQAYQPDLLIVEDLTRANVLGAAVRLSLDGTLVLGVVPLANPPATIEFLLEKTESRVLLAEALIGLICPARIPRPAAPATCLYLSVVLADDLPAGLLKSTAPVADLVAAVRESLRRRAAADLRQPRLEGQISLDDVMTILGGESHGAA